MRKLDFAIITLISIILTMVLAEATIASWSQPQVTLVPGQTATVVFENPDNAPIILTKSVISAPPSLIPYLFVSPTTIPENSSREVTFQFVQIPQSIRENIPADIYALRVSGGDSDLLVYLDLSVPLPENAENRWADLEARIDALGASFAEQMEDLAVRITALESAPSENWEPELVALLENLIALGNWTTSKLSELWESMPEDSPPSDTSEWYAALDNIENRLQRERQDADAQLRRNYEKQIADAKADAEYNTMIWSIGSALAVLCGVGGYFGIKKKFRDVPEKILEKTHRQKHPRKGEITAEV